MVRHTVRGRMGAVMGESCGPCSWAAGPWAAPSTGSRSKAHKRSRSAPRAYRLSDAGRRAWRVGSSVPAAPIPRRSGRWDNEGHGDQTPHGVRLSTSGAPFANRAPFSESQPIPQTQLLSGSALSKLAQEIGFAAQNPMVSANPPVTRHDGCRSSSFATTNQTSFSALVGIFHPRRIGRANAAR
jgi:hypothetical protein